MSVETLSRACPNCGTELPTSESNNGSVIKHPYFRVNLSEMKVYVNGKNIGLTPKEYAIFEYLVKAEGVVTNVEFARQPWGDYGQTMNGTKVHISNIRNKIREADGRDPIITRYALGYEIKDEKIIEREQARAQQADNGRQIRGY